MKVKVIVAFLLGLIGISIFQTRRVQDKVVFCDVGQGDGIIVISGRNQLLIDGGSNGDKILSCLGKYLPYWDKEIEVVVMTNTDRDHSGGLSEVLEHYAVEKFVTADGINNTAIFKELTKVIAQHNVSVEILSSGDKVDIGGAIKATLVWPYDVDVTRTRLAFDHDQDNQVLGEWDGGDINERSVGMVVEVNDIEILMMADLGIDSEREMMFNQELPDVDVLKIGHHGSKYSTSQEFLEKVKPEIAVISVGKNSYGHPTGEVINKLNALGIKTYRTDEYGDVVIDL